jgi:hypothetical protein
MSLRPNSNSNDSGNGNSIDRNAATDAHVTSPGTGNAPLAASPLPIDPDKVHTKSHRSDDNTDSTDDNDGKDESIHPHPKEHNNSNNKNNRSSNNSSNSNNVSEEEEDDETRAAACEEDAQEQEQEPLHPSLELGRDTSTYYTSGDTQTQEVDSSFAKKKSSSSSSSSSSSNHQTQPPVVQAALEIDTGQALDDDKQDDDGDGDNKDDDDDDNDHDATDQAPKIMQSLSIDQDDECLDDDLEHLLTNGKPTQKLGSTGSTGIHATATATATAHQRLSAWCFHCLPPTERVGNMKIIFPALFRRTGWGIVGPSHHWFGPPCVTGILLLAASFFVQTAVEHVGLVTAAVCCVMTVCTFGNLVNTAYRDPGILQTPPTPEEAVAQRYCWCDECDNYQPPGGAHCPDCNICIAGFDHHCVWMGTCIGRNNLQPFVRFNLSWLGYLLYAVVWVCIVGPMVSHK